MIEEEHGMINWPTIHFQDIAKDFEAKSSTNFNNRMHAEYKQGEVFRYFAWEFIQKVFLSQSFRIFSVLYFED